MKIMHLITGLKIGGAETMLYNILVHANKNEHEHFVVYFHEGLNVEKLKVLGIPTFQIKGLYSPYDPIALLNLFLFTKRKKPSLIHSTLWSANLLGRLLSLILRIPVICDLHSNVGHHGWFRNFLEKCTARLASKYVAVSPFVRESFQKSVLSEKRLKAPIEVIYNGIDSDQLHYDAKAYAFTRERIGFTPYDFIIGTVGRLSKIKSQRLLIETFSCIARDAPSARLCIVGDGPERENLEKLTKTLGISNHTIFTGEYSNPAALYPLFDCFVLTSETEGLSIALLEALAFGLPIITTTETPRHEVIVEGINGFLIEPGNPLQLMDALLKIYRHQEIREVMKKQNLMLIKNNFNIKKTIVAYEKLYKTLGNPHYTAEH